jgi:hypothetical protein
VRYGVDAASGRVPLSGAAPCARLLRVIRPPAAAGGTASPRLDALLRCLHYIPAIAGEARKRAALALTVGAIAVLVATGSTGTPGSFLGGFPSAASAAPIPVTLKLPTTRRVEILGGNRLPVRALVKRGGRARAVATLRVGARAVRLAAPRTIVLAPGRWTDVSLPLAPAGRAALAGCPVARIVVTVSNPRLGRPRSIGGPLRLDPPDCGRFFAAKSIWNSALPAGAPLDPHSPDVTADLLKKVDAGARSGHPATINTTDYAPPVYTVRWGQPRVRVLLDQRNAALARAFETVPLPPSARPAPGTDGHLVVWQPSTDTLWEFWRLRREIDGWHAQWGGRLDRVSTGPGHFTAPNAHWGATASSLPLAGGMITPAELRRGRIDHALAMAVPAPRAVEFSLPAQRTDGPSGCRYAVPEGARFRLDPTVDVNALGLPAPVAALARAAQRYGIYVRDKSESVSFFAQSAVSLPNDPYPALFGGRPAYELLAHFPWSRLQLVQMQLRKMPGQSPPLLGGTGLLGGCG